MGVDNRIDDVSSVKAGSGFAERVTGTLSMTRCAARFASGPEGDDQLLIDSKLGDCRAARKRSDGGTILSVTASVPSDPSASAQSAGRVKI